MARQDLPSGTVTFLFTDIEGSTKLLHELGPDAYAEALAKHRSVLRSAFAAHGGVEVDTQGDAFFVAFPTARGAIEAAREGQEALASGLVRVRMGVHTGTPTLTDEGYVGVDVHRAARIAAAGHGGQVLVSASTAALVPAEDLRDLGEHRLKDLSAPARLFQLGDGDFPPLKTLYQTNLPVPATPFLGRDNELAGVCSLLSSRDVHLLTLTGPGGTGKTRLALQAAAVSSDDYPQGVWWVPLASLREPDLVLETARQVLGAKGDLALHIADGSMLVLFDNFEQVIDAASDVAVLLASCPNLDVLVTSREPLHVTGEQEFPVPPLVHEEGIGLFLARARAVDPDFQADGAVSEICQRLDDLPLAIELAAARVKVLSPPRILERLEQRLPLLTGGARDLPERQRTLRATIAWSFELLSPEEQRLFARLAVFRGGCTLEAAEEIAGADLATLQSLIDKSLLRHRDGRYWMLATIREYAVDRLEQSGEAEQLRLRHAEQFLALAEESEPHLRGNPQDWLERLDPEQDNFRAALDRLEASGATELALRLAGALQRFWYLRGHLLEGLRRLEAALAVDERPSLARAKALNGVAVLALDSGDAAMMKRRSEEALALYLELGDAWGAAVARHTRALAILDLGEVGTARRWLEENLERFRELGDDHYTLLTMHILAFAHYELGDLDASRALHEEELREARELSSSRLQARALAQLGLIAAEQGRIKEAFSSLKVAYGTDREVGEAVQTALDLCRFARALVAAGRPADAARLLSRAEAFREELGVTFRPWALKLNERTAGLIRAQLDQTAFTEAWNEGRKLPNDEAVALALEGAD